MALALVERYTILTAVEKEKPCMCLSKNKRDCKLNCVELQTQFSLHYR